MQGVFGWRVAMLGLSSRACSRHMRELAPGPHSLGCAHPCLSSRSPPPPATRCPAAACSYERLHGRPLLPCGHPVPAGGPRWVLRYHPPVLHRPASPLAMSWASEQLPTALTARPDTCLPQTPQRNLISALPTLNLVCTAFQRCFFGPACRPGAAPADTQRDTHCLRLAGCHHHAPQPLPPLRAGALAVRRAGSWPGIGQGRAGLLVALGEVAVVLGKLLLRVASTGEYRPPM